MVIFFALFCMAFLGLIEFLKRKYSIAPSTTRRIAHMGTAFIAFIAPWFLRFDELLFLGVLFSVLLFIARRQNILTSIHGVERVTLGEVFLPAGVFLAALGMVFYGVREYQFGILVMGLADPFAGFVGERFGKHSIKIFGNKKSWEGSFAFFILTVALTYVFAREHGSQVLAIPVILTFVELMLVYGLDNLVLPVLAAFLLKVLV